MKKILQSSYFKTYLLLLINLFSIEMIFKVIESSKLFTFGTLRIFVFINILVAFLTLLLNFCSKMVKRILSILIIFGFATYACVQCGFLNFIGVYISFQTSSQLGAVTDYITDFFLSFKYIYLCTYIPLLITIVYMIFFEKNSNKTRQVRSLLLSVMYILAFGLSLYYLTVNKFFQDKLQTISNKDVFITASNPSVAIENYGTSGFLFLDVKALIFPVELEEEFIEDNNNVEVEINENSRIIDDTIWKSIVSEEKDTAKNNLSNYFMSRTISPKNEYTGMFENKNLIVIMMESTNDIFINPEYYPNFHKMLTEGWYWENNYSPRNACATMNNEFSGMTSLYTIANTCTASKYKENDYYESIFNIFNKKDDYVTFSAHDYTAAYYPRKAIHANMGSGEYYSVEKLKMSYKNEYVNWANDDEFMEKVLGVIDKKTSNNEHFMTWLTTVSAHQPYTSSSIQGDKYLNMTKDTKYPTNIRRYMSKLKFLDDGLGILLKGLEERGILDDTVIVMFGDHYPYGIPTKDLNKVLDYDTAEDLNAERVPFVIYNSKMTSEVHHEYTSYINILPTIANLFNLDYDPRLYLGEDLFDDNYESITIFADGSWKNEIAYYNAKKNSVKYYEEGVYSDEDIAMINKKVSKYLNVSNNAIKSNYFSYLNKSFNKKNKEMEQKLINSVSDITEEE